MIVQSNVSRTEEIKLELYWRELERRKEGGERERRRRTKDCQFEQDEKNIENTSVFLTIIENTRVFRIESVVVEKRYRENLQL